MMLPYAGLAHIDSAELNKNAEYVTVLRNAEAFVRTLHEIRALPETS